MDMPQSSPFSILHVDDNKVDYLIMSSRLSKLITPLQTEWKPGGVELLQYLCEVPTPPDLLLLDIDMPEMSGMECLRVLRATEKYKHLYIAMYSNSDDHDDIAACFTLGADSYITKCMNCRDLESSVLSLYSLYTSGQFPKAMLRDE